MNYVDAAENLLIKSVNNIYIDCNYVINPETMEKIKKFDELQVCDFSSDTVFDNINKFFEKETENSFSNILSDIENTELKNGINVALLYLSASWVDRFEIEKTSQDEFTNFEGKVKIVDFMSRIEYFPYMETDEYVFLIIFIIICVANKR